MGDLTGSYLDLLLDEMAQVAEEDPPHATSDKIEDSEYYVAQRRTAGDLRSASGGGISEPGPGLTNKMEGKGNHSGHSNTASGSGLEEEERTAAEAPSSNDQFATGRLCKSAPTCMEDEQEPRSGGEKSLSALETDTEVRAAPVNVATREGGEGVRRSIPEGPSPPKAAPEVLEILVKLKKMHCNPEQRMHIVGDVMDELRVHCNADEDGLPSLSAARELDQDRDSVLEGFHDDGDEQEGRISPFLLSDQSHHRPSAAEDVKEEDVVLYDHYKPSVSAKDLVQLMEAHRESLHLSSELSSVLRESVRSALHSKGADDIKFVMREQNTREEYVKSVRRSIRLAQVDLEALATEAAEEARQQGVDRETVEKSAPTTPTPATVQEPSHKTLQVPSAQRPSLLLCDAIATVEATATLPGEEGVSLNNSGTLLIEKELNQFTELSSSTVSLNDIQSMHMSALRTKATRGDVDSQFCLGYVCEVAEDFAAASKWYRKAAAKGDTRAQYQYARMYYLGIGDVPKSFRRAFSWFSRAAELGHRRSQYVVGQILWSGAASHNIGRDQEKAIYWYLESAMQGLREAETKVGLMLLQGVAGLIPASQRYALAVLSDAAMQQEPKAQYCLASLYLDSSSGVDFYDPSLAEHWLLSAAKNGHLEARLRLTEIYSQGSYGIQKDRNAALAWAVVAAEENDDVRAQLTLASLYRESLGADLGENQRQALRWYERAAQNGSAEAWYNIGSMKEQGLAAPVDLTSALLAYERAASKGHSAALHVLEKEHMQKQQLEWLEKGGLLPVLDLEGMDLGDKEVKMVSDRLCDKRRKRSTDVDERDFLGNTGLSVILANNNFSSIGLVYFMSKLLLLEGRKGTNELVVKTVSLARNDIGDAGVLEIKSILASNKSLTSLDLSHTRIGDAGAKVLAEVIRDNSSLRELKLSYNRIGEEGMKALVAALSTSNCSLLSLELQGVRIGKKAFFALKRALQSNCTVENIIVAKDDFTVRRPFTSSYSFEDVRSVMAMGADGWELHDNQRRSSSSAVSAASSCPAEGGTGGFSALARKSSVRRLSRPGAAKRQQVEEVQARALKRAIAVNRFLKLQGVFPTRIEVIAFRDCSIGDTKVCRLLEQLVDSAQHITCLDLHGNAVTTLPPTVSSLRSLRELVLTKNPIEHLPPQICECPLLATLRLDTYKLVNVPVSFHRSGESILTYFRDLLQGATPFSRMKMMIVGKEQVGKTSLVREICGRSPNSKLHLSFVTGQAKLERTDGIDICQWPPPPTSIAKFCTFPPSAGGAAGGIGGPMVEAVLEEKKPAKGRGQHNYMYSIWDFAGQNLYYTTHEFFLSSTAVYAVVINLLTPTSGLIEWLNSIQFRAPGSVVYLIGTFADKLTESKILSVSKTLSKCIDGWKRRVSATASMQSPTLGRKDGGQVSEAAQPIIEIKTCWYRLKKDNRAVELVLWPVCCKPFAPAQGVSEFCHSLVDHARTKVQAIPDKYFPFMAALQSRSHPPVISWQEFKDWALSFGIEKRGVLQVAQLFDCWGVIVYHQVDAARRLAVPTTDGASPSTAEPMTGESLSEEDSHDEDASMVIVSPQWLTSLFRSLVSMRHTEGGWAHSGGGSGLVRRETIEERWLDESLVQRDHFPFVWGLLNQFEICVPRDPPHASTSDTPVGSSHSDAPSANVEAFQQHKGPPAHQLSSPDELIVPACVTVKKSKSLQQLHQNLEETLHCKMSRRYAIDFLLPALFNRLSVRLNDDVLPLLSDDASGDSPFLVSSDFWDNGLSFYRGLSKTAGDKPKRLLSPISASAAAFPLSTVAVLVGTMTGSVESADSDKGEELLLLCELKDTAVEEQCFHRTLEVTVLGGGGQRDHVRKLFVAANTTIENFVRDRYPSLLHHISISCLVYSDATTCIGDEASPSLPDADGELGSSRARTGKKLRTATCYEISREFCIDQLMAGETSIPIERPGGGQLTVALEELIPEVFESGTLRCSSGYFHAEVSLLRALGAGVSAEVYHGLWKGINGEEEAATAANKRGEAIGVDVAVKMFTHKRNLLNVESLRQECLLLSSLRHPCVVRLHRFYLKPPCVLMDYHAHGSLSDFLQLVTSYTLCHADGILQDVQPTAPPPPCMEPSEAPEADSDEQGTLVEEALGKPATASVSTLRTAVAQWICSGGGLSLEFVTRIALNVASGLAYLHSRSPPVRHADIKPANVLMNCFHCPATGVCLLAAMELEASGQPSTVAGSQQLFESPQQDARCKKNDCGIEEKTERETTTTAADVDGTERHKVHCHCGQAENNCEWPDNEETVVCKLADFGFSCFESARDRDLARTEAEDDTIQFGVMMAEVVEAYVHIPLEREDQICAYRELCDLLLECRSKSVAMETARGRLALLLASLTQKTCRAM